jgi:anti-anti-sigma factor
MSEITIAAAPAVAEPDRPLQVITVRGYLDESVVPRLRQMLRDECPGDDVIIDLSGAQALEAVGTGTLLAATVHAEPRRERLAVVTVDPLITRVLEATGLPQVVPVRATLDEAKQALSENDGQPQAG